MVSKKGTSVSDGSFQCRIQSWPDYCALDRTLDSWPLRLAVSLHRDRSDWLYLVDLLVAPLSATRRAPASLPGRTGTHQERSTGSYNESLMGASLSAPSNVGLCNR